VRRGVASGVCASGADAPCGRFLAHMGGTISGVLRLWAKRSPGGKAGCNLYFSLPRGEPRTCVREIREVCAVSWGVPGFMGCPSHGVM
jgi:hypothetical protein